MNIKSLLNIIRNVKTKTYLKGETIIPVKSREKQLFFIKKGMVRVYYNHENGNEITFQIFAEKHFFSNMHSIILDKPSKFQYEAMENIKLYSMPFNRFKQLSTKNEELLEMSRNFLGKRVMLRAFERVESFVFLSPEERYKKYVKDNPNIINRVHDKYIANILGITAVSLSRIRNRIASKKN